MKFTMKSINRLAFIPMLLCIALVTQSNAAPKCKDEKTLKILYCDTSAGRAVMKNGDYSKTYCTWRAVMDFQAIHDCCTWQGGVMLVRMGKVICNNGTVSNVCSLQESMKRAQKYDQSDDSVNIKSSTFLN